MPSRPDDLAMYVEALKDVPGWEAYCNGRLHDSELLLGQYVLSSPDDVGRAWELLGLVYRDMGKPVKAADAFERASLLVVIQPISSLCLAESYAVLRRYELAKDLYMMLAKVFAESADLLLLVASGLDGIDESQLALDVCRQAGNVEPESGQVSYDMCYYAMRCGCSASMAESLAWRAVELEPDNVHFRIGLASLLIRLGHQQRACRVLQSLQTSHFQKVCCRCCLERIAAIYANAGETELAQQCLQRLHELT